MDIFLKIGIYDEGVILCAGTSCIQLNYDVFLTVNR